MNPESFMTDQELFVIDRMGQESHSLKRMRVRDTVGTNKSKSVSTKTGNKMGKKEKEGKNKRENAPRLTASDDQTYENVMPRLTDTERKDALIRKLQENKEAEEERKLEECMNQDLFQPVSNQESCLGKRKVPVYKENNKIRDIWSEGLE